MSYELSILIRLETLEQHIWNAWHMKTFLMCETVAVHWLFLNKNMRLKVFLSHNEWFFDAILFLVFVQRKLRLGKVEYVWSCTCIIRRCILNFEAWSPWTILITCLIIHCKWIRFEIRFVGIALFDVWLHLSCPIGFVFHV